MITIFNEEGYFDPTSPKKLLKTEIQKHKLGDSRKRIEHDNDKV